MQPVVSIIFLCAVIILTGICLAGIYRGKRALLRNFNLYVECLKGKSGLEIAGPSKIFQDEGLLPIYSIVSGLDNCDYSDKTLWNDKAVSGGRSLINEKKIYKTGYICDATDLYRLPPLNYDFVAASHVLEHIANPFKALQGWIRLIRDNGFLLLIVPHKDATFDHKRPVTKLEHLLADHEKGVGEEDLTHLSEILALHDIERDPGEMTFSEFRQRAENNLINRVLHHHVFDTDLVIKILDHLGLQIISVDPARPRHIIVLSKKLPAGETADNEIHLSGRSYAGKSPFPSDGAKITQ